VFTMSLVESALCFLKISMPAQLIGIDFAPSLLLATN